MNVIIYKKGARMTEKERIILEYKKEVFKGREKEFVLSEENKNLCKDFDEKKINTSEVLKKTKMSKATFFRMLKEYREQNHQKQ